MQTDKIIIYTDGASKGNPGKAGAGVVFVDGESKVRGSLSWFIPVATNNQAEYTAILFALQLVYPLDIEYIEVRSDSLLMINQLHHKWMIKDETLKVFFNEIEHIISKILGRVVFVHIPREQNKEADALANKAIIDHDYGLKL